MMTNLPGGQINNTLWISATKFCLSIVPDFVLVLPFHHHRDALPARPPLQHPSDDHLTLAAASAILGERLLQGDWFIRLGNRFTHEKMGSVREEALSCIIDRLNLNCRHHLTEKNFAAPHLPHPSFPPNSRTTSFPIQNFKSVPKSPPNLQIDALPTMLDIMNASTAQNLDLQLNTLGPFFRITARSLDLDSLRLRRETIGMQKSIFGIGLFIGAVAIRHGFDCGCRKAELLAINDTDLYHSKLVKFYKRLGFEPVYEVTGSSFGDFTHMLVWGGVGTRMDANLEHLMLKWCSRFKPTRPTETK